MRNLTRAVVILLTVALAACHAAPIAYKGQAVPGTGGTISGVVRSAAGASLEGRRVTAIDTRTSARFEGMTGANGGYTIQVPPGMYRIELTLLTGERITTQPAPTEINVGDLDAQRDFVVGGR
jgi:hypothetical protein